MAVLETVVAIAISIYLALFVIDGWSHVIVSCAIAPMLLLRTEDSTRRGILYFRSFPEDEQRHFLLDLLYLIIIPAIPVLT
jgi:hypothetical protein